MKLKTIKQLCFGLAFVSFAYFLSDTTDATPSTTVNAGICSILSNCINNQASISIQKQQLSASNATATSKTATPSNTETGSFGYTNLGIANVDGSLNIRKDPSKDGELVGKLPSNAGCEILNSSNGWYQIQSGKVSGWVSGEFLLTGDQAKERALSVAVNQAKVKTQTLYVREQPTKDSAIVSMVANDEELEVVATKDGWAQVVLDVDKGWISMDYATISKQLPKASTITELKYGSGVSDVRVSLVQFALQYVGNRYVWGGTNLTKGIDCSGFTMRVYEHFGIGLPHYSGAQAGRGKRINSSSAKPGDLFFYGKGGKINHVAIYIGNGQIVHASSPTTGIKVSGAFYRTPICVIRLIND